MEQAAAFTDPSSFEDAVAELEAIVRDMEGGQLPLEKALAAYERGAALLKYCHDALDSAEQKLRVLEADQVRDFAASAPSPQDPDA